MARVNPCCIFDTSVRSGTLSISIIYMIASLLLATFCLREYAMHSQFDAARKLEDHTTIDDDSVTIYKYMGLFGFSNIWLNLSLWYGAMKKNRNHCLAWLSISTIVTAILGARVIFFDVLYYRFELGLLVFNLYCLWVVWEFIGEIIDGEKRPVLPITVVNNANLEEPGQLNKKRKQSEIKIYSKHPYHGKPMVITATAI